MVKFKDTYIPSAGNPTSKIWIVADFPEDMDIHKLSPLTDRGGSYLFDTLYKYGISREACYITFVSHYQPIIKSADIDETPEYYQGLQELSDNLALYKPNCILALGNYALTALTGKHGITLWRGSILTSLVGNHKVIPCLSPNFILRNAKDSPTFDFDVRRFSQDVKFPDTRIPERQYVVLDACPPDELERWTNDLCNSNKLAVDIETVRGSLHILCIGFSPRPDLGVCFAYNKSNTLVREAIERILLSKAKKIFHFGTFDVQVLRENGFSVENYWWDTMAAQHVMWCELPRSLAYLTSIYTRQPYYKHIGGDNIPSDVKGWSSKQNKLDLYIYNCKDVCVTSEIQADQEDELNTDSSWVKYFRYKMEQIHLALRISANGLPIDQERRALFKKNVEETLASVSHGLNLIAKDMVNANSPKQMAEFLYGKLGLQEKKKRGKDGDYRVTTDEDAIVSSIATVKSEIDKRVGSKTKEEWDFKLLALLGILKARGLRKLLGTYIDIAISPDGMLRSTFKVCSTETSRWACETYVDESGTNAQTFPRGVVEVEQ